MEKITENSIFILFDKTMFDLKCDLLYACNYIHPEKSTWYDNPSLDCKNGLTMFPDDLLEIISGLPDVCILCGGGFNARTGTKQDFVEVALLISTLVVVHTEEAKRQLGIALAAAEPFLSKLIMDKLHLNAFIGKVVGDVTGFFNGKKGSIPVTGTQLTIDYNMHKCKLHFGKRIIINHVAEERCEASACENKITHSCKSCTKHHQADAVKCAVEAELKNLQALAKQAAAQQG